MKSIKIKFSSTRIHPKINFTLKEFKMTVAPVCESTCRCLLTTTQSQSTTLEKSLQFGRKLCITNYNFYAFLCWYNYVLLVSCWISFFRVCCLLVVRCFGFSYVNSSISSQHSRSFSLWSYILIQHKGGISYSFSGIVVVIHGTSPLVTHTSIEANERFFNNTELFFRKRLLHYIGFIIALIVITKS